MDTAAVEVGPRKIIEQMFDCGNADVTENRSDFGAHSLADCNL